MTNPVENFDTKALIEGTPGFSPSMYQHIKNNEIDTRGLAKEVKNRELNPLPVYGLVFFNRRKKAA